jgi:hypothetical protein
MTARPVSLIQFLMSSKICFDRRGPGGSSVVQDQQLRILGQKLCQKRPLQLAADSGSTDCFRKGSIPVI